MRAITIILMLISGCQASQHVKPTNALDEAASKGDFVYTHEKLYSQAKAGQISWSQVDNQFSIDSNECKIQSLQVPIPSPSCVSVAPPSCYGLTGVAFNLCQLREPYTDCDRSSVNEARRAQRDIKKSCMGLRGWELVWQERISNSAQFSFIDGMLSRQVDEVMEEKLGIENIGALDGEEYIKEKLARWSYIVRFDEYKNAHEHEKRKMRDEYFNKALAPRYSPEHVAEMRAEFETLSKSLESYQVDKP